MEYSHRRENDCFSKRKAVIMGKTKSPGGFLNARDLVLGILSLSLILHAPVADAARKNVSSDSPLTEDMQLELYRASKYMKSRPDKAMPIIESALQSANDIPKCMAIAAYTEPYGHPLLEARRACINKALSLCTTRDDFLHVAIKARQYECFEATRTAVNSLVGSSKSVPELYDLASKAQEVALNDVAHLAMERAFKQIDNVEDALKFARQAKIMGMDDLVRNAVKALINDETETRGLCILLRNIEPFDLKDLNRSLLKRALDTAKSVQDFNDICDAAKRHGHEDVFKLAQFRGKKMVILNKYRQDSAAYQQKLEEFRKGQQQAQQQSAPAPNPSGF